MTAATLVFAWGNPSRGDDSLGPRFAEGLAAMSLERPDWGAVEFLTDFQLQIEHALDLQNRSRILFVDASVDCQEPFAVSRVQPARDATLGSHAMTPQAVLHVYRQVLGEAPPPTWQMAIRGVSFDLGEDLSGEAGRNLKSALHWASEWLGKQRAGDYNSSQSGALAQDEAIS
jgi:hydrogenase maturation protease